MFSREEKRTTGRLLTQQKTMVKINPKKSIYRLEDPKLHSEEQLTIIFPRQKIVVDLFKRCFSWKSQHLRV